MIDRHLSGLVGSKQDDWFCYSGELLINTITSNHHGLMGKNHHFLSINMFSKQR